MLAPASRRARRPTGTVPINRFNIRSFLTNLTPTGPRGPGRPHRWPFAASPSTAARASGRSPSPLTTGAAGVRGEARSRISDGYSFRPLTLSEVDLPATGAHAIRVRASGQRRRDPADGAALEPARLHAQHRRDRAGAGGMTSITMRRIAMRTRPRSWSFPVAVALAGVGLLAWPPRRRGAQELRPAGADRAACGPAPGHDERACAAAEANCRSCHSVDYIAMQPPGKGAAFWTGEVTKMRKVYHAPIERGGQARPSPTTSLPRHTRLRLGTSRPMTTRRQYRTDGQDCLAGWRRSRRQDIAHRASVIRPQPRLVPSDSPRGKAA